MFSLSNLNLHSKKNSSVVLSDFQNGSTFSILCLYESSASSDTGQFFFIQQNLSDGLITIKKLIWISESVIYSFSINPSCDWLAVALRNGAVCILPLGALMGRVQRKCEPWKTNDVTYLSNKLNQYSPVTCMKWWTSYKHKNTCLIGKANGDFLIIDLTNGSLLFSEEFPSQIQSIDLLISSDRSFSYAIITSSEMVQWKLLLEEVNNKEPVYDKESGFETVDIPWIHSTNILDYKYTKKAKREQIVSAAHVPTKFYQFSESVVLKSQFCNDQYYIGAYDRSTGKYKLFDCANLDSFLYEFQLPLHVVDICVTEELLFVILKSADPSGTAESGEIPSIFQEMKPLKLCVFCRQYALSHLYEKYSLSDSSSTKIQTASFKPAISETVPNMLRKSVLFEAELNDLCSAENFLGLVHFKSFFNLEANDQALSASFPMFTFKNPYWIDFLRQNRGKHSVTGATNGHLKSKWSLNEVKQFTPVFLVSRNKVSICHLRQCFEDKFIDSLLENDTTTAEWLGAGLRLDMNFLYQYTAHLLASGNAKLGPLVTKSRKSAILEFFDLGYISTSAKMACLTQFWPVEECLQYALGLLAKINSMSPIDRCVLSNGLIPMFGHAMSEPMETTDGILKKKNKYYDKFRRFVLTNCFFNDFKAAKTMIGFGQIEEAFFIAKEKGCVVELFKYIIEKDYSTNWSFCYDDLSLQNMFARQDRDSLLSNIGLMDLEIVARSDPLFIKCFGEFICESLMNPGSFFSFKTTTHLCTALNPYGSIIDSLFHIYSCTATPGQSNMSDLATFFERNSVTGMESLTSTGDFSKNMKIRREIGPELVAFCLLVISRDNQVNEGRDFIYFIQLYEAIDASTNDTDPRPSKSSVKGDIASATKAVSNNDLFESKLMSKSFKAKRNTLSNYWLQQARSQCLVTRNELCISISVFDLDLFDDIPTERPSLRMFRTTSLSQTSDWKKSFLCGADRNDQQRCQINMLGFQREKTSRVLLLPKSIETGREIIRQITLGKQHVLILTDCGSVYGAGSNSHGQLGIERSLVHETSIKRKSHRLSVINPQPINFSLDESEMVVAVVAGDFHSGAIIVDTGCRGEQRSVLATWGWGVHGQLGHGDIEDQRFPRRLTMSGNEFPIQLAMGCYHSVVLTNEGNVYTFGNNSYGQLGTPEIQKSLLPIRVTNMPRDVKNIDTKYFHTVCCTASNQIFAWGLDPNLWQNQYNQNKSHTYISTPTSIDTKDLLTNEKVVQISCGTSHTTILTEKKLVYSFGFNMMGQLGLGNRKEHNHLVEVKVPKPIDYISTDNGITVAMTVGDKSSKLMIWGRSSHPLVQENIKDLLTDTVQPQQFMEYQHSLMSNFIDQNSFGIDALCNSGTKLLNKHQLMIFFRSCSEYLDRNKLISILEHLKEFDIIADFYLVNEMLIKSLFWRVRSLVDRMEREWSKDACSVVSEDAEIIFQFYIRLAEKPKVACMKAVITMITGFFKKYKLPWNIYERIVQPLIVKYSSVISSLLIKSSMENTVTSTFIRDLLLNITDENCHEVIIRPPLGSITLQANDVQRFHDLIKSGTSETIYDAADDHKVAFFAECGHAAVLGRYRDQQVKSFLDRLRRRQLNFSTQMIQRLYDDGTILPDCLECLTQRI